MSKTIKAIVSLSFILLTFNACKAETKNDINEFIKDINTKFNYNFEINHFLIEKKENIVYHTMTDNNTLFSLYSNKKGEIIQCTLSSFDKNNENNYRLIIDSGSVLTTEKRSTFEIMLKNAATTGKYSQNGWTVIVSENEVGITYIINHTSTKINNNEYPTVKRTQTEQELY